MCSSDLVNITATSGINKKLILNEIEKISIASQNPWNTLYCAESFPGLNHKISQMENNVKIVTFSSGKFNIVGSKSIDELDRAFNYAKEWISKYLNNLEDIANNIEHIIQNDFATIVKQTINNHLHKYYNIQDNNFVESSLYKNVIEYLQSSLHNVKLQYQHNSIKLDPKLENLIQSHIYNNYEQMVESFAEKYPNVPYHIPNHNLTTSDKIHFLDFENNEYTIPAIEILEQKRQGKQKLDIVTSGITELFYNYFNDVQQNELNIVLATFGKKIS